MPTLQGFRAATTSADARALTALPSKLPGAVVRLSSAVATQGSAQLGTAAWSILEQVWPLEVAQAL